MIHHYITKYEEDGKQYAEAWLQINILGRSFCFSKRKKEIGELPDDQIGSSMNNVARLLQPGTISHGCIRDHLDCCETGLGDHKRCKLLHAQGCRSQDPQ